MAPNILREIIKNIYIKVFRRYPIPDVTEEDILPIVDILPVPVMITGPG